MTVSPEVKAAVEQIRKDKDLIASMREADKVRDKQLADLQAKLADHPSLSDEDKQALQAAVDDMRSTNDELGDAVPANTERAQTAGGPAGAIVAPAPLERNPDAERADPLPGTGQNGTVPLMPNSAFDPDPTGSRGVSAGQPNQPQAIETAGGFVIAGGGSTVRAPGSDPTSPSSTLVVPEDPNAKAAANNADVIKSGLGDSSQNATLGNDGQPIGSGPGIPQEPTQAQAEAAQKLKDAQDEEMARREANPLNLAPAGTPQAGSAAAQGQRLPADAQAPGQEGQPATGGTPVPDGTPMPPPNPGTDGDPNQKAPA